MTRGPFEGVTLDSRTRDMFVRLRWKLGMPLVLTQGSYNAGGVSASAGTHDGGGVFDIRARDLTDAERVRVVLGLRQIGFAAWLRNPSQSNWPWHIHAVAKGCPDLSRGAANQVTAYNAGYNGLGHLGRGGPDDGPSGYRSVTWESYNAAHPDEEFWMINGEEILRRLEALEARLGENTDARAQYAYKAVTSGGTVDARLDVLEARVGPTTDARAQHAYTSVIDGTTAMAIADLRRAVTELKAAPKA